MASLLVTAMFALGFCIVSVRLHPHATSKLKTEPHQTEASFLGEIAPSTDQGHPSGTKITANKEPTCCTPVQNSRTPFRYFSDAFPKFQEVWEAAHRRLKFLWCFEFVVVLVCFFMCYKVMTKREAFLESEVDNTCGHRLHGCLHLAMAGAAFAMGTTYVFLLMGVSSAYFMPLRYVGQLISIFLLSTVLAYMTPNYDSCLANWSPVFAAGAWLLIGAASSRHHLVFFISAVACGSLSSRFLPESSERGTDIRMCRDLLAFLIFLHVILWTVAEGGLLKWVFSSTSISGAHELRLTEGGLDALLVVGLIHMLCKRTNEMKRAMIEGG